MLWLFWPQGMRDLSSPAATTAAKLLQSCPTLCNPMDCSLPGFSVHGILQARTLERVAISFSNAWKRKVKVKSLSRVRLFETPWTAAHQAPPSMWLSRQKYWSGVPLAPLSGIKPASPALEDEVLTTGPQRSLKATKFWKTILNYYFNGS